MRKRGREIAEYQGGSTPLEWVDEGAQAIWDERQRRNEMKRVWVRVGVQARGMQDDDNCWEPVVMRNIECACVFQKEIMLL